MSLKRLFVAEVGGAPPGDYLARAKCTRCVPPWVGPVHTLSDLQRENHGLISYEVDLLHVRDQARVDVLRHADHKHDGRL